MKKYNNIGIDILFTDAEDMGRYGESDTWAIGSKLFSQNYPEPLPQFAICVDMVGDKDLEIKMEQYSYQMAPQLMNYIWNLANQKGYDHFKWELGPAIVDDHLSYFVGSTCGVSKISLTPNSLAIVIALEISDWLCLKTKNLHEISTSLLLTLFSSTSILIFLNINSISPPTRYFS